MWHGPEAERCWALIDQGAKTDNIEERKKIFLEVQKILSEECISRIRAVHVKQLAAMTEHVQGFDQNFGGRIY